MPPKKNKIQSKSESESEPDQNLHNVKHYVFEVFSGSDFPTWKRKAIRHLKRLKLVKLIQSALPADADENQIARDADASLFIERNLSNSVLKKLRLKDDTAFHLWKSLCEYYDEETKVVNRKIVFDLKKLVIENDNVIQYCEAFLENINSLEEAGYTFNQDFLVDFLYAGMGEYAEKFGLIDINQELDLHETVIQIKNLSLHNKEPDSPEINAINKLKKKDQQINKSHSFNKQHSFNNNNRQSNSNNNYSANKTGNYNSDRQSNQYRSNNNFKYNNNYRKPWFNQQQNYQQNYRKNNFKGNPAQYNNYNNYNPPNNNSNQYNQPKNNMFMNGNNRVPACILCGGNDHPTNQCTKVQMTQGCLSAFNHQNVTQCLNLISINVINERKYIFDTGAMINSSPIIEDFIEFKEIRKSFSCFNPDPTANMTATGIGTIRRQLKSGLWLTIPDVYYFPTAKQGTINHKSFPNKKFLKLYNSIGYIKDYNGNWHCLAKDESGQLITQFKESNHSNDLNLVTRSRSYEPTPEPPESQDLPCSNPNYSNIPFYRSNDQTFFNTSDSSYQPNHQ